ncbi:MAG TPA: DUF948 domain-containing protein [Mycobacteriales bacterium]|nr:DUF948 domain-containing protein [Mycobacteriales bacterium]
MVVASGGLSGGEVAGLIVAVFWAVLVCFLAFVLVKLGKVIGEAAKLVEGVADQTVPLLGEVTTSVVQVNAELTRVDTITANVQDISTNAKALTSVFAATLGSPLIKVAAFSYGVRRAINQRNEADVRKRVKAQLKQDRAAARSARRGKSDA